MLSLRTEVEFGLPSDNYPPELYINIVDSPFELPGHEGFKEAHMSHTPEGEPVLAVQGSRSLQAMREYNSSSEIRAAEIAMLKGLGTMAVKHGVTKVSGYVEAPTELDAYKEAFGDQPFRFVDAYWNETLPMSYEEARESLARNAHRIEDGIADEPEDAGMFIGVDISGFRPNDDDTPVKIKNEFDLTNPPSYDEFMAKNYPKGI